MGALALLVLGASALLAASASAAPTVTILTPADPTTLNSGTIPITLDIQNFTLNGSAVGMAAVPGEGHYHLYLDGNYQKFDYTPSTFLANVPQGAHIVKVELANNDHTLLGINASVNVTISVSAPRVRILSPGSSASWNSSSVELNIWKDNFTYNPSAVGQAAVAGEGHYHVLLDGVYWYFGTTDFFNLSELTPGHSYVIRVGLYNNDHTPIAPPVFDEIRVTIAAGAPRLSLDFGLFGANVNASSIEEPLNITNFTIDPLAIGQAAVAGRGHYHAWLDGVFMGPAYANPILLTDLSVGVHTLVVELRNNDHSALSPRVVDFTTFTVLANAPRVTITSPADPSTVNASSVELAFTIDHFTIAPGKIGQAAVAGEGHWHVYVDGAYMGFGTDLEALVSDLSTGSHVITIELHNNDHSDLTWPAFDVVRVAVPANAPRVTITSPAPAVTLNSSSVDLAFTIGNFTLAPSKVGQAPVAGEGHWHLYIDGVYVEFGTALTATATRLQPGTHTIVVELHNNDHSDLTWPAFDQVSVTVQAGSIAAMISSPAAGASLGLNFTALTVSVSNFSIVDKGGQANVVGEGHYHIFVDGVFYGMAFAPATLVTGLSAGPHTIRVILVNNDHSALTPAVVDEVSLTAGGLSPSIAITSPASGATLYGATITVTVSINNFTLAPSHVGQPAVNGEGHWHVFVDDVYKNNSATTSLNLTGLAAGDHTIKAQLYNNDHTPLAVEISSSVTVHVAALPSISITSPTTGTTSQTGTISVTVAVLNFTLIAVGSSSTNVAGQGHYHVFVDGNMTVMVAATNFTLTNLAVGIHTVKVALVNNDHTFVAAGQNTSEITVIVTPPLPAPKGFLPGFGVAEGLAAVAAVAAIALTARRRRSA